MAELYEDISASENPRIRILFIEPAPYSTDPLVCALRTFEFGALPEYVALSYVWGNASQTVQITCNDAQMHITKNLHRALINIRLFAGYVALWADAICINQADMAERSSQVQLMGDIYRHAGSTLIWLGDGDVAASAIIDFCRELGVAYENRQPAPELIGDSTRLTTILQFFERPWWKRSWVIQELCFSQNPILMIGNLTVPWSLFARFISQINDEVMEQSNGGHASGAVITSMMHLIRSEGFVAAQALRNKKIEFDNADKPFALLDVLSEFRNFATSDPRDKIYSLLSLTSCTNEQLLPDYTVSTLECYVNTAAAVLESTKDLRLFEALHLFERYRDPTLPSWVPQWDGESKNEDPGLKVASTLRSVAYKTNVPDTADKKEPCNASRSLSFDYLEVIYPNILVLEGFVFDSIKCIGPGLDFPQTIHDGIAELSSYKVVEFGGLILKSSHFQGRILDAMMAWNRMANDAQAYSTKADAKRAFLATIYGPDADLDEAAKVFDTAMRSNAPERGFKWAISSVLGSISSNARLTLLGLMCLATGFFKNASFGAALPNCWDKRLGTTTHGYIGLFSKGVRIGDKIALLKGGHKPFAVRPVGDKWSILGVCYIHGIMKGEMWAPEEVFSMEFV